jgi:hypothetical protein
MPPVVLTTRAQSSAGSYWAHGAWAICSHRALLFALFDEGRWLGAGTRVTALEDHMAETKATAGASL